MVTIRPSHTTTLKVMSLIGGFRNTHLGKQVVSRAGGLRAGMGSPGGLGSAVSSLSGVWGGGPAQPKSNLVPFSLKVWHQVATISIIFLRINWPNFARLNSKEKSGQSQKYLGRQCLTLPLIKSAYDEPTAVILSHETQDARAMTHSDYGLCLCAV